MNEIERAIDIISTYNNTIAVNPDFECAMDAAIAALREKQARESGCDYCLTTWPNYVGWLSDIWHGNQLSVGYGVYREINYCPMCGAKLEEAK
jgi:hypothetical protein